MTPEMDLNSPQFESDRARIKRLPRAKAPSRIAANVAKAIQQPVTMRQPVRQSAGWLPYAVAASVLLAVSLTTFLLFRSTHDSTDRVKVEPVPSRKSTTDSQPKPQPEIVASTSATREELPLPGTKISNDVAVKPVEPAVAIPADDQKWLGARIITSLPDFQSITARTPCLFHVNELENGEVRQRIAKELNAYPSLRLDLFTKDSPKAVEQLTNAFKSSGTTVTIPAITAEQLKRKMPITVTFFSDSLTAEEWTTLIKKMQQADSLSTAHLFAAGSAESKELKSLFGSDLSVVKRSKDDVHRSVADWTIGQVTQAIHKPAKVAIATTAGQGPTRVNPALAPEIRQYLERRGDRPANTISMMVVIKVSGSP